MHCLCIVVSDWVYLLLLLLLLLLLVVDSWLLSQNVSQLGMVLCVWCVCLCLCVCALSRWLVGRLVNSPDAPSCVCARQDDSGD